MSRLEKEPRIECPDTSSFNQGLQTWRWSLTKQGYVTGSCIINSSHVLGRGVIGLRQSEQGCHFL
jgi:hypothetical protein